MTDSTPPNPDDAALFDGFKAVEEAGGIAPFVTELLAETYRITNQRIARFDVDDYASRVQIARDVVREVTERRLYPYMRRELDRHVDQEIQRLGLRSPDAIERLAQATYSRLKPVNDRRFEVLLQHASPEAANDHTRPRR